MIFLLLSCSPEKNRVEDSAITSDTLLLEAIEKDMEEMDATAFSMAIIKDGEVSWSNGFGTGTKDGSTVTSETLYRIASITKPMTAVLTLQQIESQCLSLSGDVDSYLEDFSMRVQPELSSMLTVEQTLNMTGGLVDYQQQTGEDGDGMIDDFLSVYLDYNFFLSEPGRMYNYSNPNFVVAGRLVEICTGEYFRSVMENKLWNPLQMNRTTFLTDEVVENGSYAVGVTKYWPTSLGVEVSVDAQFYTASHLWPAMGAWSSVDDLAKFALFLLNGNSDILDVSYFNEMQKQQIDTEEGYESKGYGYGLDVKEGIKMGDKHYPVKMISHTGAIYGYSSHMYLIPELQIGVVALVNREKSVPKNSITLALNLDSLVESYEEDIQLPQEFSKYVGEYFNAYNIGTMILTETEAGLEISIPALDSEGILYDAVLEPVRPNNFHIKYPNDSFDLISFLHDSNGNIEFLRIRNYVGKKVQEESFAPYISPERMALENSFGQWEQEIDLFSGH